ANAVVVAQVCRRLDGIPLAIELAAARAEMMSAGDILDRLEDRFRLLTGGSRTAMPRHQTLRAALDWGHALLNDPERRLFRRLGAASGRARAPARPVAVAGAAGGRARRPARGPPLVPRARPRPGGAAGSRLGLVLADPRPPERGPGTPRGGARAARAGAPGPRAGAVPARQADLLAGRLRHRPRPGRGEPGAVGVAVRRASGRLGWA